MSAARVRRTIVTAGVAVAALLAVPLVDVATAAGFEAKGITTKPEPDSNNVVAANRPQIVASFSGNLAAGSSVTLTVKGGSSNLCASSQIDGKDVSCTPTQDLALDKTYVAVGHGVSGSGAKADTDKLEFTVSYPKFQPNKSAPVANGAVVLGNETLTAQFDQEVTGNDDSFQVFEVNPDGSRGTRLGGSVDFPSDPVMGPDDSVTYKGSLANGKYEAVVLVLGVDGNGDPNTAAVGQADYFFYVDNSSPSQLTVLAPNNTANNVNAGEFPFSGLAPPGVSVDITVPDDSVPQGLNDASGSGDVAPCGQALCPWTVTVDVSGLPDSDSQPWSARTTDAADKHSASADGPPFVIDQTPPPYPDVDAPEDGSTITTPVVPVGAHYETNTPPSDFAGYHVTITDAEDNVVEQDFAVNAANNGFTGTVDVSTLDDGDLSVLVKAQDTSGNRNNAPSPLQSDELTVHKKVGLLPNLGTSTFTANGTDTTFTDAAAHAIGSPTVVTVKFTQTIKKSWTDFTSQSGPTTHNASLCVATTQGNCVASSSPTVTDDERGLQIKLSSPLADRSYILKTTAFSKNNCPDKTPANFTTHSCESYSDVVKDPTTQQPYTFTVDTSPPVVTVDPISPNPIGPDAVTHVSVSGSVSSDVTSGVQLVIKSDAGKGTRIATATVTPPAAAGAAATWSASGLDLSALRDGKLTFTAKAKDNANNTGTGKATAKLAAHRSKLTEKVDRAKTTFGKAVHLSGRLTDENGDGIVSATITVQAKFDNGKLGKPVISLTNSKGRWTTLAAPKQNSRFIASYEGQSSSPVHDAATNNNARVRVHALVKITSPDNKDRVSSTEKVKGKVKPNKHGKTVRLYRKTGGGRDFLGKDRLNRHSRFTIRAHLPGGTVKLIAVIGKTKTNLGGKSKVVTVTV